MQSVCQLHMPLHTPRFLCDIQSGEPVHHVLQAATHVYNKKAAVVIYKKLAAARKVVLPQAVSQEDQTLFAGADQPDPMDVLAGIHDPGNGGEPAPSADKPAALPPAPAPRLGGHSWASRAVPPEYLVAMSRHLSRQIIIEIVS